MALKLQVVFDSKDPDSLAKFYAEALHYKMQDPPSGYPSWEAFLKAQGIPESEWNSGSAIVDPEGKGPRIYIQRMDTPKTGKNRVHIDINATSSSRTPKSERKKIVQAEVSRILSLGAKVQREWEEGDDYWFVMLDPEGNEFCIQ